MALHPVHGYAIPPPQDVKVSRRNARERNRVQSVNHGFDVLKRHIPSAASVKKMSKVNILSHAVDYIEALTTLLKEPPTSSQTTTSSTSLSFPPAPEVAPSPYHPPHQPCYPSYPPPLTPISPNTHPYYQGFRHYESGYETSGGFYSESDCPPPATIGSRSHSWGGEVQTRHYPYCPPSPTSPPGPPASAPCLPPLAKKLKQEKEESSGEEDDILDAIAEWQQTS